LLFSGHVWGRLDIFNALFSGLRLHNFIQITPTLAELWRHIGFQDASCDIAILYTILFWWLRSIRKVKIYVHMCKFQRQFFIHGWDITTSGFWKQTSPCRILLPVSLFIFASSSPWHSASAYQTLSKSDHWQPSYDIISIFKTAATASQFYFRFRPRWLRSIREGRNLHTARFIYPQLRYYYFWFLETNVRHVVILLPVSNFTFASSAACHSASACQISSKSYHPRQSYDVTFILRDGGHGIAILLPVSFLVTSLI